MDLRLISHNVECYPWSSISIRQKVAILIQNANIIALQGVWCRHPEWTTSFAEHGWTFVRPARESHFAAIFGTGLAVAFSERWHLQDSRLYPFTAGIDLFSVKGWYRVDLIDLQTGIPIRLLNVSCQTTMLWVDWAEEIRMAQSRQLTESETERNLPTLLMGEFNTTENWFRGFRLSAGCGYPANQTWIIYEGPGPSWLCKFR
jgi:hypothetical protein